MKMNKDKKIFALIFAISAMMITMMLVHGCSISSYGEKTLTSISVTPDNNTIAAGTVQQFMATGLYSDQTATNLSSSSLAWSTSDPSVATVSATGLATTAVASHGTCTVTAVGAGATGTATLTIKNLPLKSITVTPGSATVNKGLTQQFTASGLFSDGTDTIPGQDITSLVTWSSSTINVATIDPHTGLVTGVAGGTTDITASITNAQWGTVTSAPITVTVSNVGLQSIAITMPNMTIHPGGTPVQLTATGTFVDTTTQDMTSQVVWSSLNPDIGTVDSSGLFTGVTPGRATINATAGGITGTITITVFQGAHT